MENSGRRIGSCRQVNDQIPVRDKDAVVTVEARASHCQCRFIGRGEIVTPREKQRSREERRISRHGGDRSRCYEKAHASLASMTITLEERRRHEAQRRKKRQKVDDKRRPRREDAG